MNKQPLSDRILYEDNHLIAVNKLPSEIVQGDKTGDVPLSEDIKQYIKQKYNKPGNVYLGVIHRIDRPASGVVVFARTGKALTRMNELVKERKIEKIYWAIVKVRPENDEGELRNILLKNEKKNKSFIVDSKEKGAKEAILITTHIMSFVEEIADEIVFLLDGEIYFKGTSNELKERTAQVDLEHAIAKLISKDS